MAGAKPMSPAINSALELEFELRDRAAAPTGSITAINGQFHLVRSDMDGSGDAVDGCCENRLQFASRFLGRDRT